MAGIAMRKCICMNMPPPPPSLTPHRADRPYRWNGEGEKMTKSATRRRRRKAQDGAKDESSKQRRQVKAEWR